MDFSSGRLRGEVDPCIPNFHIQVVEDVEQTRKQGKPVFREEEFVEVIIPGNDRERPCFKVTQEHKDRWPEQYKRFSQHEEQHVAEGFYIEEWPQITRSLAATLKHHHILTVEQLAGLPDSNLMNMGPGMLDLKFKAQKFVEMMKDEAVIQKMGDELKQRDQRIELLEKKLEELSQHIQDAESTKKPPVARSGKG